jgi:hypothetical protein
MSAVQKQLSVCTKLWEVMKKWTWSFLQSARPFREFIIKIKSASTHKRKSSVSLVNLLAIGLACTKMSKSFIPIINHHAWPWAHCYKQDANCLKQPTVCPQFSKQAITKEWELMTETKWGWCARKLLVYYTIWSIRLKNFCLI